MCPEIHLVYFWGGGGGLNFWKATEEYLKHKGTKIRVFRVCFRAPFLPHFFPLILWMSKGTGDGQEMKADRSYILAAEEVVKVPSANHTL